MGMREDAQAWPLIVTEPETFTRFGERAPELFVGYTSVRLLEHVERRFLERGAKTWDRPAILYVGAPGTSRMLRVTFSDIVT